MKKSRQSVNEYKNQIWTTLDNKKYQIRTIGSVYTKKQILY